MPGYSYLYFLNSLSSIIIQKLFSSKNIDKQKHDRFDSHHLESSKKYLNLIILTSYLPVFIASLRLHMMFPVNHFLRDLICNQLKNKNVIVSLRHLHLLAKGCLQIIRQFAF